jgi:CRISPR/Cas system-associated endonuclease Cas3-HD
MHMADNLGERGMHDRSRINVNQPHEISYWSKKFGVSEAELRSAVEQVGPMADKVEQHLGRRAAS